MLLYWSQQPQPGHVCSGDHLVGWANASLRHTWELPELPSDGIGVVRAEPLQCAYWPQDPCWQQVRPHSEVADRRDRVLLIAHSAQSAGMAAVRPTLALQLVCPCAADASCRAAGTMPICALARLS